MKQQVIKELSTPELIERLEDEENQLQKMKLHHKVSELENPRKISAFRKTIARLKSEMRRRELEQEKNI
ncbi:MAG TPA: 50S ribosomal protein L29 [Bacteroidales bacterium]|nr:50S ribosomal protein L29 [Bacteroidales bacterium]HRZ49713.1 50S ribosomal protein L29 [Bacteroidales bacterium]